jgi:hypothetical protein
MNKGFRKNTRSRIGVRDDAARQFTVSGDQIRQLVHNWVVA